MAPGRVQGGPGEGSLCPASCSAGGLVAALVIMPPTVGLSAVLPAPGGPQYGVQLFRFNSPRQRLCQTWGLMAQHRTGINTDLKVRNHRLKKHR